VAAKLSARRAGLTLLELMLALSLSVVLLFAVGLALRLYWRSFDVKRTNVEQAHLARAILRKMEDDLRTAVQYTPVDLSGLESMTSSSSLSGAFAGMTGAGSPAATAGGSTPGTSGGATGAQIGGSATGASTNTGGGATAQANPSVSGGAAPGASANSSASKTGSAPSTQSGGSTSTGGNSAPTAGAATSGQAAAGETTATETTAETPPAVVGLYGSANQLQFDVSRLPRVDEYAGGSAASMVQIPSDIKTLTYYVRSDSSGGSTSTSTFGSSSLSSAAASGSSEPSATGQGRGLMRLEMDRAVSAYSESNGSPSTSYDGAKLLADEVTSIAFRYWNGTEWVSDWNSDEMGGLPLAVEIVMTMADPTAAASTVPAQNFAATTSASTEPSYRMVVNLPTASLPPPVEEPATTDEAAAAAGTSTPGSSSSATTPGSGSFSAPSMGGSGTSGSSSSGSGASSYGTGSKTGGS
jgi:hypothetical protein